LILRSSICAVLGIGSRTNLFCRLKRKDRSKPASFLIVCGPAGKKFFD
jgi:hypothetical protein